MAYIKFNDDTVLKASVTRVGNNIIRVNTTAEPNVSGFTLYLNGGLTLPMSNKEYLGYNTIYRQGEGWYELSNDGSVYIEPPKYIPTISFVIHNGGILNGTIEQQVSRYEDLEIPTVSTEAGFEFKEWNPEIPTSGETEGDQVFRAVIEDKNVYFYVNGIGYLEGESKQTVDDYSQLVIPTAVPEDGYDFVGWSPVVPTEGAIDSNNNKFHAMFKSNIAERLGSVEGDLTDTQLALIENYDLSLTTAEDVSVAQEELTDVQLALVEIYDLIMGGM